MGVESIHIVWSEPSPPPDSLVSYLQQTVKANSRDSRETELRFEINEEDSSLNNRFKEIKGLRTEAIFSVDDDVIFACSTLEFAFSVWQTAPHTMVGFVPRMHWIDRSVCFSFPILFFSLIFHPLSSLCCFWLGMYKIF